MKLLTNIFDAAIRINGRMYSRVACSYRRQQWSVLLKKVWDIDALKCPKCGGNKKVISFIEDPPLIKRIL